MVTLQGNFWIWGYFPREPISKTKVSNRNPPRQTKPKDSRFTSRFAKTDEVLFWIQEAFPGKARRTHKYERCHENAGFLWILFLFSRENIPKSGKVPHCCEPVHKSAIFLVWLAWAGSNQKMHGARTSANFQLNLRRLESRFAVRSNSNRHRFAATSNRTIRTARPKPFEWL